MRAGSTGSSIDNSEQIKALEESLAVPLFDRIGNRLRLTEPGERLRGYADRLLTLAEEARAVVQGGAPAGVLTLTAPETVCTYVLPPILRAFRERCPDVEVRFVPMPVREFKRSLLEGSLDLAFILEEAFATGALHVEVLRQEPVVVIVGPEHPLRRRSSVRAADLVGEDVFLTEVGCSYRNRFERALIRAGAHPRVRTEFQSVEAIKRCVASGLGVAALPAVAVARELAEEELAIVRWADDPLDVATHLAWSEARWIPPALERFVGTARSVRPPSPRPGRAARASAA
jgi:DNA-binding transcriptional LysR family regulator